MSLLADLYRGGWLRTVDHAFAESLRRLRPDTPDAVLATAALCSRAVAQGHSQLPLAQVGELLLDLVGDREPPTLPALDDWCALLRASPFVGTGLTATNPAENQPDEERIAAHAAPAVLVLEGEALSLRRYWKYETRLATAISKRAAPSTVIADVATDARLAQLFPDADGDQRAQAEAARALLSQRFLLLTGGPGTGKTTTVARALVLFAENFQHTAAGAGHFPRIALAAPTGKAAARLAESVRDSLARLVADATISADAAVQLAPDARTLHRLLGWRPDSTAFRHDAAHPLPADLVVVDEASMIDLPLMCKLVEAVPEHATLLLIGDRDQLPSVETGDVLAALCDAADAVGTSLLATAASDSSATTAVASKLAPTRLARIHLTHSHRQSEDIDVPRLAALVRDGHVEAALAGLDNDLFRGVHWRQGPDRALAEAVLAQALPAYAAVCAAANVEDALAAAKKFRVLAAIREGAAGSQTLNAVIAAALDPARRGEGFFHGRLVLVTENSYRHGLFNGDIGIAWRDAGDELRVWFDADGGPRAWLPAALPAHESAFALTVHKSQGSEFERVFLALPERNARPVSRELIYTGLTRCRQAVTLWASEATLREGIARQAQRWSGLAARLRASET